MVRGGSGQDAGKFFIKTFFIYFFRLDVVGMKAQKVFRFSLNYTKRKRGINMTNGPGVGARQ